MATPLRCDHRNIVESTQDEARRSHEDGALLVTATGQRAGRGRNRSEWLDADRALAASLAFRPSWPAAAWSRLTLVAGLAALDALPLDFGLKWPNDVIVDDAKAGGMLTEVFDGLVVVGFGLNVYWAGPPSGMSAVAKHDPGPELGRRLAEEWSRRLLRRVASAPDEWGAEEYVARCVTIGRDISWEPNGSGTAVGVGRDGALLVESDGELIRLVSGEVRLVRDRRPVR